MTPIVNGKAENFAARGLYNGLALLSDDSTGSYWDHITGECVHGELKGEQLEFSDYDLLYTTVAGALKLHPDVQLALSPNFPLKGRFMSMVSGFYHKLLGNRLPGRFERTIGIEDNRRERMDVGLGLWTNTTNRYYPLEVLKAASNGVIDIVDGRSIFVYYSTDANAPDAFYIDAQSVEMCDGVYHFDSGYTLSDGRLHDTNGQTIQVERPQQMFTRWYGFAFTFPNCDIYEAELMPVTN